MAATVYSFDHYTESWIEVSSQPSSSSLSSAAADDAGPTGVRVQYDQHGRRRRRLGRNEPLPFGAPVRRASGAGSSQEEYEESESESDRIMTSSNEALEPNLSEGISSPPGLTTSASEDTSSNNAEDDEDDENSTALGAVTTEPVFTPQPNAFSHPPQPHSTRHTRSLETRTSYFPAHRTSPHRRPAAQSYPSRARGSHSPYNILAPSHSTDHDAALRASLSTLLSCARALPKREGQSVQRVPSRVEPSSMRLMPESEIVRGQPTPPPPALWPHTSVRHRTSAASPSSNDKGKRKASMSKDRSHRDSGSKKRRASSPSGREQPISPTLMTWVMGAGVVVLVSAISYSAGYVVGKEVGRFEAGTMAGREGIGCGREVGRGLIRFRWGASSGSVIRI